MSDTTERRKSAAIAFSRRDWLIGAVAASATLAAGPTDDVPAEAEDEAKELEAVEALGREVGLRPFRTSRTAHYLGIGDARDDFRALTMRDCEAVAEDYFDGYRSRGFALARPPRRLTVVTLADDRSFAAFLRNRSLVMKPGAAALGQRPRPVQPGDEPARRLRPPFARSPARTRAGSENLRTLAHEATHQLTFNSGLLERDGDVPSAVSEGLATFGEVRRSTSRTPPGQLNRMRLQDLATVQRRRVPWIPIVDLLSDDPFGRPGERPGRAAFRLRRKLDPDLLLDE